MCLQGLHADVCDTGVPNGRYFRPLHSESSKGVGHSHDRFKMDITQELTYLPVSLVHWPIQAKGAGFLF